MKPSSTSCRVASSVACGSGSNVSSSPLTSTLMKFENPAARARRARRTAPSAVVAPAVFGSSVKRRRSMPSSSERPPSRFSRRMATVIMSGWAASRQRVSTAFDAYFPVPWIRRERSVRPPTTNGSSPVGDPPPTKYTSSSSSPSRTFAVMKSSFRRISRLCSTTTRDGCTSSRCSSSNRLSPSGTTRGFPFSVTVTSLTGEPPPAA